MLLLRTSVSFVPAALAALTLLAVSLAAPAARAQTIFTDDFNAESGSLNYTNFANWNVNRGSVDVLGFYAGFGQAVDMDGSTGAAGLLVTKTIFNLTPGAYTLSFALGKNGGNPESMTVSVGNAFSALVTDSLAYPAPVTQTFNFTLGAATTGAISFDHQGGDNQGYVIDNVSLVRATGTATAPEPGSVALALAAGVPALAMLRRHKKR